MCANTLKLNDSKTEFIVFGSPCGLKKVHTSSIKVGGHTIALSPSIRNIGAFFDPQMTMETQVSHMCKSAWFQLYNMSKVRHYLTSDQIKAVVHAYVTSKLDNNNALLTGLPHKLLSKLQRVQNAAARLITRSKKCDHITPILYNLHWLPIKYRILFKVLVLTFKALDGTGPEYIRDLLSFHTPSRTLRSSSDTLLLHLPRTKLKTYGDKCFSALVPAEWNKLPISIRSSLSLFSFKSMLKTHFFKLHYVSF